MISLPGCQENIARHNDPAIARSVVTGRTKHRRRFQDGSCQRSMPKLAR